MTKDIYYSNNKRIAKNTIVLTIRMIIVLIVNLFTTTIVISSLGVVDFGIYSVVGGLVTMFTFLNVSMSTCIQRFFNFELGKNGNDGARRVYITSLQIDVLLGLIIVILTETIGLWYLNSHMVLPSERMSIAQVIFQLSVLSLLLNIFQVPYVAAIVAHEQLNFYALISLTDVFLKFLIAISMKYMPGDHLLIYGVLMVIVVLFDFIAYYTYAHVKFKEIRLMRFYDKKLFKSMFVFSSWNIFGTFAAMMKEQGINMVINLFFGPVVNAARGISYQVMGGLNGFAGNVSMTTRPQIIKSYAQGDLERTIWLFFLSSKLCFMAIFIFALPIIVEMNYILTLWLNENVPKFTGIFTFWILITAFISNLNGPTSGVVHATGKMKKYQLVNSIVSLSVVPLSYWAYKQGAPPETSFVIVFVITALCQLLSIIILRSLIVFSVGQYMKDVIISLFLVVVVSFIFTLIPHLFLSEGFVRLIVVTCTAVIAEVAAFTTLALNKKERNTMLQFVREKIHSRRG